jgi:serine/threonine protein kinase
MSTTTVSSGHVFLNYLRQHDLVDSFRLDAFLQRIQERNLILPAPPKAFAELLVKEQVLTRFQANLLLQNRHKELALGGKYRVLDLIGFGSIGKVYLCEHIVMRRKVALKMFPNNPGQDLGQKERFLREARALAALGHRNIVQAYDIDEFGGNTFLVLEYVEGVTLQELVQNNGPLPVAMAANFICQAAQGLQHAHEAGMVHRDIKPSNLLLDHTGIVKILDLGLTLYMHDVERNLSLNYCKDTVLGTADYMSPEQGRQSHGVDIRADIYSLGATFFFLLTGKPPFPGTTAAQKLFHHQTTRVPPIREIRADVEEQLAAILQRMTEKEPSRRFASPMELANALQPFTPMSGIQRLAFEHQEPPAEATHTISGDMSITRPLTELAFDFSNLRSSARFRMPAPPTPQREYSLLMLSVVLLILGLTAGLGLGFFLR